MIARNLATGIGVALAMFGPPVYILGAAIAGQHWAQYILTAALFGICGLMLSVLGSWTRAFWQRVKEVEAQ